MFHLSTDHFPENAADLSAALLGTLRELFTLPSGREPIRITGPYPVLDELRIDLSGASARADQRLHRPLGVQQPNPGPSVREFEVCAEPLLIENAAMRLHLHARQAQFHYNRDRRGRAVMVLAAAQDGQVEAHLTRADIEAILLAGAQAAAQERGLTLKDVNLKLTQLDSRSVGIDLHVTVKKLFVTAPFHLAGQIHIDDALNAELRNLTCDGEGMIASLVGNLVRPHLQRLNGRQIPLMALSLGQIRLRDLRLSVTDGLHIHASFAS